jgi:valyl-tRNA synthetase
MRSDLFEKAYEPQEVERRWYAYWEEQNLFAAVENDKATGYSIVIPPPNVTGVLHMGHALNNTLQDILCRYRRLRGDNVLWMPGTDHAGIATQNVVEKQLANEGTDRHRLGREKFIEAVWAWKEKYGSAIINQLKRLGASCDWQRERFTMDEGLSRAVRKVFVQLYHEGLIYRGNYIINWCHRCHTALADLEVEHEDIDGNLYYIRYPFETGNDAVVVATTRPETMLGDTAVAVNPDDSRYRETVSDKVILPLMERPIPIIKDEYVDMTFGTGALKVTPAHDPNDFEIATRHNLAGIKVIGDDGLMTADAGQFAGLDRFEARTAVVEALKQANLLGKIEPYRHSVGHCYRCHTMIEPNLSRQWFVRTQPLAEKAIAAVDSGKTRIVPETWKTTYYEWMNNIKDWCISRQIWWGHQIPAWTCEACNELVVAMEAPRVCPGCQDKKLVQETDVLDTWFSSALWPFSTMGWPEETPLLKIFYPTSVLVTAFDILFFWVARMMMMGIHFMGDVPFKDVYVHALIRDEEGKKMSKSSGNVIDPLLIIDKYGTDAFRFTLAAFAAQGRDIKMSEKRVEGYRHFVNKIWNAARFASMHLEKDHDKLELENISLADRWILSRLHGVTHAVSGALDTYRFNEAAASLYNFVWHEFCDWYLEAVKPILYQKTDAEKENTLAVLRWVLCQTLVLLHPFMPFVTEEIYQQLPGTEGSIMRSTYPSDYDGFPGEVPDPEAESQMELITGIITGVRNVRGEMNIPPSQKLHVTVQADDEGIRQTIEQHREMITTLARLKSMALQTPGTKPAAAATSILDNAIIFVSLEGILDFEKETKRLAKEIHRLTTELDPVAKKLGNESFLNKAPAAVIQKVKEKQKHLVERRRKLQSHLDRINQLS